MSNYVCKNIVVTNDPWEVMKWMQNSASNRRYAHLDSSNAHKWVYPDTYQEVPEEQTPYMLRYVSTGGWRYAYWEVVTAKTHLSVFPEES